MKGGNEEEQREGNKVEWRETNEERRDIRKKTKRRKGTQKTAYLAKSTTKYQVSCSPALSETG